MNNKDLSVIIDNTKLNIRVGAFIKYQDKILVEKTKNIDFAVLPGGRIKTLENSYTSLLREIKEELNIDLSNEPYKLISLIENFFNFNNETYHELYFIYLINLKKDYNIKDGTINLDNNKGNYYWLSKEEFQNINILPNIIKEINLNEEFKHYIINNLKTY